MVHIGTEIIDLKLTLMDSAQCFRWTEADGWFGGIVGGEPVWLMPGENGVYAEGGSVEHIRDYLDLNRDYSALAQEFSHIPVARQAIEMYPGLRVLNQDPWDALVTFIISANNNVTRIRNLCDRLAERFGEEYRTERGVLYGFPSPEKLASCDEAELRAFGMGYRSPYLIKTAQMVAGGFPLNDLCRMDYMQAHELLTTLQGVGDKVADCVLLFGCRHASAFPVDTWVEKLLRSWFGVEVKGRKKMMLMSRELLGEYAGLLQQFLFHAARTGGITLD